MMPILVKADNVDQKWNKGQCLSRPLTASMGITGSRSKKNKKACLSLCVRVRVLAGGDIVRQTGHQKEFCIRDLINLLS